MSDRMTFPDTVEEFMEQYKVVDTDGIYMSKGAELVPIFRMRQWFEHLPSVQPEIVRCKDCKHWKDSDGVYRRGTDAESKCPLNTKEVYVGTFYCGYAKRRIDE